jgi:O-antigen ligase
MILTLSIGLYGLTAQKQFHTDIAASGDYRLYIWDFAAHQTLKHLPFGIGIDGSRSLQQGDATAPFLDGDLLPIHPHNVPLQIWLELGFPGVLLATFLLFLGWYFITTRAAAVQPFLYGYATSAIVTLSIAYGMWQAWWLAGHALALFLLSLSLRTYDDKHNAH